MTNIWMGSTFILAVVSLLLWRRVRWLKMDMERVERSKVHLNDELVRMEYLQLSQQIQPHFLFNALNLLLSLARLDRKAELLQALEHLALFLRSGYASRPAQVSIESELAMSAHYLAIQKMRFGSRLSVEISCSESCGKEMVIPYLIQTFIENAFKHGLEKQVGPVKLEISFTEESGKITLAVKDNGPPTESAGTGRNGAGLHNLRRRLHLLFASQGGIELVRVGEETQAIAWWPSEKARRKKSKGEEVGQ